MDETLTTEGQKLETAKSVAEAFSGYDATAGRQDAIWHVARFIESQDVEAFDDAYAELTNERDETNSPAYVTNFKVTVRQLTDLITVGRLLS